ncbi:MAG TPA: hypothetical protein VIX15_15615 [Streptosporangiaceae bacterium]
MSMKDEVRASAGAHRDLGPGYDTAVAEGLVERIGEEIDRRVDARLFGHLQAPAQAAAPRPRRVREPGRIGVAPVFLALVSMGAAIGATVAVVQPAYPGRMNGVQAILVALIWIIIGAINISYARRS